MSASGGEPLADMLAPDAVLTGDEITSCCASVYAHPAVRWLLGEELHPGGEATTRRSLEMVGLGAGDRLLDVASGAGTSAMLAAREFGAEVVGVEYGSDAVAEASAAAAGQGLAGRIEFLEGDAEQLPIDDGSFDVVLCECSLCTFSDKERAVAEIHRALRPGGRAAVSDVVADEQRLPEELRGELATIACVGGAMTASRYEELLGAGGFDLAGTEPCTEEVRRFAQRVEDRLRGARLLGFQAVAEMPIAVEDALAAVGAARKAIAEGTLGYAIFGAVRR